MDFKHKTFRKCGSHYSDLRALDGVEVKVGQNFQPPKKVALPVGFHQNDPSDVLSLTYDFTVESKIIAAAEELHSLQLQQEKEANKVAEPVTAEKNSAACCVSTGSVTTGQAIFSTVGTDILQPTTCTTVGHKRNDSHGKNPFDLSDFEAQDTNPFELVELQTINDLDELKSVLQSSSQSLPPKEIQTVPGHSAEAPAMVTNLEIHPSTAQQLNYLESQRSKEPFKANINSKMSKSVPDLTRNQLVDISSEESTSEQNDNVASSINVLPQNPPTGQKFSQPSTVPTMGYGMPVRPFDYLHCAPTNAFASPTTQHNDPVLVDVNSSGAISQASLLPPLTSTSTPLIGGVQTAYPLADVQPSFNIRLPPLRVPPPVPPRLSGRKTETNNIDNVGVSSPVISNMESFSYPNKTEGVSGQDVSRFPEQQQQQNKSDGESDSSLTQSLIKRKPAQRRHKSKMDSSRPHRTPLPPIPSSSSPPPPSTQSTLLDPTPVLSESEKRFVNYIGIMGFPSARIARAVQRLGEKDREVIDFLVSVEKLTEKGFLEDDVEIALSLYDDDDQKALEFLKLSKSFKQLGFEESYIQEALKAADNDRDKALDFLTSISAS